MMTDDEYRACAFDMMTRLHEVGDPFSGDDWSAIQVARRLLELLPPPDENQLVSVDWFRSVGAEVKSETDGYQWCCLKTGTHTQDANEDGEFGPVVLEFGFREDGSLYDAVVATYRIDRVPRVHGPDVNIPGPVTRGKVRKLAEVYGTKLKETT